MRTKLFVSIVILLFFQIRTEAQDTTKITTPKHKIFKQMVGVEPLQKDDLPKVAFRRSLILPGWGQITNKQYVKAGMVYASAAVGIIIFVNNNQKFIHLRNDLERYVDSTSVNLIPTTDFGLLSRDVANSGAQVYRRYRDFSIIGFTAGWLIWAIEAHVAAHLKTFDINRDISMKIQPKIDIGWKAAPSDLGLKFTFNFK